MVESKDVRKKGSTLSNIKLLRIDFGDFIARRFYGNFISLKLAIFFVRYIFYSTFLL